MEKRGKVFLILAGMFVFMIIFPTTFWVLLDGIELINKAVRQTSLFTSSF